MGWMRYPGRLAHLARDEAVPIEEPTTPTFGGARAIKRVGTRWSTRCGRVVLRLWFDDRPRPHAVHVDALELRLEQPRGWCMACLYEAAIDALIVDRRDLRAFQNVVQWGLPATIGAAADG